jgi:hypothetical protein
LWFLFEWGGYEDQEIIIHISLLFFEIRIKPKVTIKTMFCYWSTETKDLRIEDKQRTFWFMIWYKAIVIWYWKPGSWLEWGTTKAFYYYRLRERIFWKPKYTKEYIGERKELEINIPELDNEMKVNTHKYRYAHEVRTRKYFLHTSRRESTEVEAIWDAPRIPGKGTCWHNCWDDSILWFGIKGHVWVAKIRARIAKDVYYYRSYYPL